MRVLFDHIIFQLQKVGGVSKALTEMIAHLPEDITPVMAVRQSENIYLREFVHPGLEVVPPTLTFENFLWGKEFKGKKRLYDFLSYVHLIPSMEAINMQSCKRLMAQGNYDVFQLTHYTSSFLGLNKKPFVFIIHDLVPELFPQYYPRDFKDVKEREVLSGKADRIIAISENTKRDILSRWNIPEDRVSVIHWGAPDVTGVSFHKPVPYQYILFVGGREGYKRFRFFVQQAVDFLRVHPDLHVICTGHPFTASELSFLTDVGLRERFHQMTVSSNELFSLYHYAFCFVFPSEYEGFGLPTLEAMACGCPVLISDNSCFPEIGGDAAMYIESTPGGDSNIGLQLSRLASMTEEERNELTKRCRKRAAEFSWVNTANQYADIYRNM